MTGRRYAVRSEGSGDNVAAFAFRPDALQFAKLLQLGTGRDTRALDTAMDGRLALVIARFPE